MIEYRHDFQCYWPVWDTKPHNNFDYIQAHLVDMDYIISLLQDHRLCIQAGGHAGLWPNKLKDYFKQVIVFEPDADLFQCCQLNCNAENVTIHNEALSSIKGKAFLKRSGSSGSNRIGPHGEIVETVTIDSLNLPACDAIFLDIEHHELQALEGATETLRKFKPALQIEVLDDGREIETFLKQFGYKRVYSVKKDRVYIA